MLTGLYKEIDQNGNVLTIQNWILTETKFKHFGKL